MLLLKATSIFKSLEIQTKLREWQIILYAVSVETYFTNQMVVLDDNLHLYLMQKSSTLYWILYFPFKTTLSDWGRTMHNELKLNKFLMFFSALSFVIIYQRLTWIMIIPLMGATFHRKTHKGCIKCNWNLSGTIVDKGVVALKLIQKLNIMPYNCSEKCFRYSRTIKVLF